MTRIDFSTALTIVLLLAPLTAAQASEVDFSCMSYQVWTKTHVSDRFRDYDIVLQNDCPGPVYWSMCIERMDPWNSKILETHMPSGYVEAENKARVNLHIKRGAEDTRFRNRFREFYVNMGYGIESPVMPECIASGCEQRKRELRAQILSNEASWERVEISIEAQIEDECPEAGWDATTREECETRIREAGQSELDRHAALDEELRAKMAAIDPEGCKSWSGELTDD